MLDLIALRKDLHAEEEAENLAIICEDEEGILTDDYAEDRIIPYHLVPPTLDWVKGRILFAPSVPENDREYLRNRIAALILPHADMLVCLNRIILVKDELDEFQEACLTEEDIAFLEKEMDCEAYEIPDIGNIVGVKWHFQSSVMIMLGQIERTSKNIQITEEEGQQIYEDGIFVTALHELRHLGLECNPFLPEEEYPISLYQEEAVEGWARDNYKF